MAKPLHSERLLILKKTYPVTSWKHREISWVAALNGDGKFHRLYPVPLRLLEGRPEIRPLPTKPAALHRIRLNTQEPLLCR